MMPLYIHCAVTGDYDVPSSRKGRAERLTSCITNFIMQYTDKCRKTGNREWRRSGKPTDVENGRKEARMTIAHEVHVKAFLDGFHEGRPDFKKLLDTYFSDDAFYQPLVPMRVPSRGREAIRAELERQYEFYSDCDCIIHAMGSSDSHVFTERTDTVTLNHDSRRVETRLNAVFDIDANGKICGWREYYDSGDLIKKLGVTMDQFEQIMAAA